MKSKTNNPPPDNNLTHNEPLVSAKRVFIEIQPIEDAGCFTILKPETEMKRTGVTYLFHDGNGVQSLLRIHLEVSKKRRGAEREQDARRVEWSEVEVEFTTMYSAASIWVLCSSSSVPSTSKRSPLHAHTYSKGGIALR